MKTFLGALYDNSKQGFPSCQGKSLEIPNTQGGRHVSDEIHITKMIEIFCLHTMLGLLSDLKKKMLIEPNVAAHACYSSS